MRSKHCPACLSEVKDYACLNSVSIEWRYCPHCGINLMEHNMIKDFINDFWGAMKKMEAMGYSIPQAVLYVSKMISGICK